MSEFQELREENERLRQWVADLQSGMYINCVYCGHRYGPSKDTPAVMADVLKAHIEGCPEHPMSKLKHENEELKKDIYFLHREANKPWNVRILAPTEKDPFRRLDCILIDVGYADRVLIVHCEKLNNEIKGLTKTPTIGISYDE